MECEKQQSIDQEERDLRRGPWTVEEDLILINHISKNGEGRWNSLAKCAGLKRTGKSCRLRWLNYLRPDVRRGNITPEEQLLILDLHSRWGNRWSKIAQHLPGRTDNEIKNYWRTRVQKHAKQLQCDVNSKRFRDAMHFIWIPRLLERIRGAGATSKPSPVLSAAGAVSFSAFAPNSMADTFPESSSSTVARSPSSSSPSYMDASVIAGGEFSSPLAAASGAKSGDCALQQAQSGGWWSDLQEGDGNLQRLWEEGDLGGYLWNDENVWFF